MKQADQPKGQLPVPATKRIRTWLLGGIVTLMLLMAAGMLIVPRLIDVASLKHKIQAVVTEQTGGQVDYQGIDFSYFPRLSIELRQVTLAIPALAEGTVAALRISPEFLAMLAGDLRLARLELDKPQFSLVLPDPTPAESPAQPSTFSELTKSLALAVTPLSQAIAGLELQINDARLAIARSKQKPVEIKGLSLSGGVEVADARMTVKLDRLALAEPALALTGNLTLSPAAPAITLNLSGTDIDVDATRRTALALAGDTTPIKQIFDCLRGGRLPQLIFTSHGDNPSELGKLNNILIKGQLQDGKISIPQINLDLTEVAGDVVIEKGILQGTGLSARLDKSTGRDGSLQIGLTKENDLLQLDLPLSADLANTRSILQRVVRAPAFSAELEKIANLQGTARGKLTLGDSLHDIGVKVEVSEVQLSADYQRVPLPIAIAAGRLTFNKKQLELDKFSGSLGKSRFADLTCRIFWEKDLSLDTGSGRFDLDMAELYPWLASLEGLRGKLEKVQQVTGRLALSALDFKGEVSRPSAWQFTSTGSVQDLSVATELFPNIINFAGGGFKVDRQQLTFEKLRTSSQDAALILSGSLHGFPQRLDRIELALDGSMGPQSVEWLSNTLKVPASYAIRAPLSFGNGKVSWQPDSTASFKGLVSIEKGPAITADVDYRPGQLQVKRLHIKDRYSDADMVFDLNKDRHDFKFAGRLQYETLQTLFVDPRFDSGRMEGDIAVTVPQGEQYKVIATGQLTGEQLPVLLPSGDKVHIDRITLKADGPQVKVDIAKLTWRNLSWEPVEGTVTFDRDRADISLARAKLCGIDSLGIFSFTGDEFSLDLTLKGKDLDVATSYTCLTGGRVKATGSLDFASKVAAKGKLDELVKSLKGPLDMTLSDGVIERDKFVSRTLEVLNVTEIVKGRLPNLATTGFAYTTMTLRGEFKNGKLIVHKGYMDGETLDLIGNGEIRLENETLDVQLLAAPFKTVDTIIKHIPGVNYLLAGSLVAIPISITGTLDDPKVEVMSASAVGSSLYNLAERAITSPFKLIEKINPWSKRNKK